MSTWSWETWLFGGGISGLRIMLRSWQSRPGQVVVLSFLVRFLLSQRDWIIASVYGQRQELTPRPVPGNRPGKHRRRPGDHRH